MNTPYEPEQREEKNEQCFVSLRSGSSYDIGVGAMDLATATRIAEEREKLENKLDFERQLEKVWGRGIR